MMQECNAASLFQPMRCVSKLCRLNIPTTCRKCGADEGHMHNRIGRRAAVAGADAWLSNMLWAPFWSLRRTKARLCFRASKVQKQCAREVETAFTDPRGASGDSANLK